MASSEPQIRITVDGRLALTINQAAQRYDMLPNTMRKALDRAGVQPIDGARLERLPLYSATAVKSALASRPGRGAPGVPRPHKVPADRTKMAQRLRAAAGS